ncbi:MULTISPECIES: DUF5071 domain-containing protein [unclassified Ruminococcus]|uniref:DUF5071 domain-containing protein n=1 Tax=unclassified Ruminococcus TaxID=2608920 RepID=UPI00210B72D5|nr:MULTISPECIES: DUF5071 domain-containing protein [unclassified Ruminococcus]MCQ4021696.1 DUF5071 domain-containing protein [Ruminococcus sp. zg-924]MCQ4114141.1 DUF5071 domain-containing protein [Ruminococcus sp. zg-921]
MVNIDYIMDLLDWNNSIEKQEQGVKLAKNVKCINVFLQPGNRYYGKNVWDNCAKILSARSNEELSPYLIELMEWLQDMNWPGAFCILNRLKGMVNEQLFQHSYTICLKYAQALDDDVWESNLRMLKADS